MDLSGLDKDNRGARWRESNGSVIVQKAVLQGLASVLHSTINVSHETDSSPKQLKCGHNLLLTYCL